MRRKERSVGRVTMELMRKFERVIRRLVLLCVLVGIFLLAVACYGSAVKTIFLSTSSPNGTYTVNLTGRKERPVFFTNEVRFDVLKNGKPFVSDQFLHSGDAMDLSFESGYPDYRWVDQNILHFYRGQNFNGSKPDALVVVNNTDKVIKYLIVYSTDKFLIFDLKPHSETNLLTSQSRGDSNGFSVKGEFAEGGNFENGASFKIRKELRGPFTYHIYITDGKLTIENPELEKLEKME